MNENAVYDLVGIGIGPFNLGLAALATELPELNCLFMDQNPTFHWHPGLLIPGARMQVPYYADLVTLANPQSPYSYLCYLKAAGRTYRFGVGEQLFPLRKEYNSYCRWVAGQLPSLRFDWQCHQVDHDADRDCYVVTAHNGATKKLHKFHAKHLVIGTGTVPYVPPCIKHITYPLLLHSADYLHQKEALLQAASVTIIGSGQSAAEIYYDLLPQAPRMQQLSWFTRSGFWPMEDSPFALEMASPEYIDYFYQLPPDARQTLLASQGLLYKGVNKQLLGAIYELLYTLQTEHEKLDTVLAGDCELVGVEMGKADQLFLELRHGPSGKRFTHTTAALVLATGYKYQVPDFLWPITAHIRWAKQGGYQVSRNYTVDSRQRIFVQNAELHTHGFNSADLGLGPYRNAVILNTILGRTHFVLEKARPFQIFGVPS